MKKDNAEKRTGTDEYAKFMSRLLRSYGRKAKAQELDVQALVQLAELRELLDEQTRDTVHALRVGGFSWAEIGDSLGLSKSAAFRKYGEAPEGSPRKQGGQPAHMR